MFSSDRSAKQLPTSPYLDARREWNERYGSYIIEARNWRSFALFLSVVLLVSAGGNWVQASREKIAIYYVNTDPQGRANEVWRADQATPGPKTEHIRAALQAWLLGARTVYVDSRAIKRLVDATYAMTLPDSAAHQMLVAYHREHNPYQRAAHETVELALETPVQLTPDTWQLEWTETVKSRNSGKVLHQHRYQLTAHVLILAPKDEAQLLANPMGLYVRQFSWPVRHSG